MLHDAQLHDRAQKLRRLRGIHTERAEAIIVAAVQGDRAEVARLGLYVPGSGPVTDDELAVAPAPPPVDPAP